MPGMRASGLAVGYGLAWGVLAAGLVQLAIVWVAVRHAGITIGFRRPRLTPNVKRLLVLALPAAITGGITQINQLIGTAIASGAGQRGLVARLCRPHLPAAARRRRHRRRDRAPAGTGARAESRQRDEAANLQNRSVEFTLFLTLPAAVALLVMSEPIVRVLYERGAFAATSGTPTVGGPGDLRPRPAGLRADQGVHARLFRPRGHAHADVSLPAISVRGQRRRRADAVPADRRTSASPSPRRSPAGSMPRCCSACSSGAAIGARDVPLLTRIPRLLVAAAVMGGIALFRHRLVRRASRLGIAALHAGARARGSGARSPRHLFRHRLRHRRRRFRHDPPQHQAWRGEAQSRPRRFRLTACLRSSRDAIGVAHSAATRLIRLGSRP